MPLLLPKKYSLDFACPKVKPVGNVEIDWTNDLSRGLVGVYLMSNPILNLVSNQLTPLPSGAVLNPKGIDFTATSGADTNLSTSSMASVGSIACSLAFTVSGQHVLVEAGADGAGIRAAFHSGVNRAIFFINGTGWNSDGSHDVLTDGKFRSYGFTWDTSVSTDSRIIASDAAVTTRTGAITAPSDNNFRIGARVTHDDFEANTIEYAFFWGGRELTVAELAEVRRNPYQLLKPINQPIYFTESAATGDFTLTADSGGYTYTGAAAALTAARIMPADSGVYTYTGTNAALTFGAATSFTLTADSGAYAYSGTSAGLIADRLLTADSGAYTYTGTAVDLNFGFVLNAESGAYTYTGTAVTFVQQRILSAISGNYAYTGTNANIFFSPVPADIPIADGVTVSGEFGTGALLSSSFGTGATVRGKL